MKIIKKILAFAFLLLLFGSFAFGQISETEKSFLTKGQSFLQNNEIDKAIQQFDLAILYNPKSVYALYLRGTAKFFKQDMDGAMIDLNKVIEIAPNLKGIEQAYNIRAGLYFLKKDNARAFADYDKAIKLNPNYPEPYNGRANIFYFRGEIDKALADYNKAIELKPGMAAAYVGRADIKFDKGDFDSAISDLDKSLELTADIASSHIKRGIIYGLKGSWLVAFTDLRKGAEINSQSKSPNWGNLQTTLSDFDKYISSNPKNANAYAIRGLIKLLQGKETEAEADLKKCFELNPKLENELDKFIKVIKETN